MSDKQFELTPDVVTNLDLGRILREAENLDDFLYQTRLRTPGSNIRMPKTTHALEDVAKTNGFSLMDAAHRKHLIGHLRNLKTNAPKIHISFAVEPPPAIVQKIVIWMRRNIQKDLVVEVGVQPTISVGCVVRTTNKVFDMSLRHRFFDSKRELSKLLENTK
ncbi:MAG TPA: F0F1 ATP synthase subunit delta [Candidatus Saccharimonadales bacterium]|nr:F0F1 ATP synthase subunit delta [Candidatus Saccharimonadales bacterium]